jgi:hypothetical protein
VFIAAYLFVSRNNADLRKLADKFEKERQDYESIIDKYEEVKPVRFFTLSYEATMSSGN